MSIELTEQQQQALDCFGDAPPRIVDPRTHAHYVLVPESDYEAVREVLEAERCQSVIRRVARQNAAGRVKG